MNYLDLKKHIALVFCVLALPACLLNDMRPTDETETNLILKRGDLVISNGGTSSIVVLDSSGRYKGDIIDLVNGSESIWGLHWDGALEVLYFVVDGSDRVMAFDNETGITRSLITNINLNGNLRGIVKILSGDLLIVESNVIERFSPNGIRKTAGGWPKALQTAGSGMAKLNNGGFVLCSTGTDRVGTYTSEGLLVDIRASGIAGTTDAISCSSDGSKVAVAWSGTADTIQILSPNLDTIEMTYSDVGILGSPSGVAFLNNGNLVVTDAVNHHIAELNKAGELVRIMESPVINIPRDIAVIR
jgi:hypothetical protein